jgi:hypothetical protein
MDAKMVGKAEALDCLTVSQIGLILTKPFSYLMFLHWVREKRRKDLGIGS